MQNGGNKKAQRAAGSSPFDADGALASNLTEMIRYSCSYCGCVKASSSTGHDGRVRIRCDCGGKYADNSSRMHAM